MVAKMSKAIVPEKPSVRGATSSTHESGLSSNKVIKMCQIGSNTHEVHLSFGIFRLRFVTYLVKDRPSRVAGTEPNPCLRHKVVTATFLSAIHRLPVINWIFTRHFGVFSAGFQMLNLRPGWSKIFQFASNGDISKVAKLISSGANVNARDRWGVSYISSRADSIWLIRRSGPL